MLIYSPAYDIYHCIYRIYNIIKSIKDNKIIEFDRVRIIDFHIVFPSTLLSVEFPLGFKKIKNKINEIDSTYREVSNKYVTFQTMYTLQLQAIDFLRTKGYINIDTFKNISKSNKFNDLEINKQDKYFLNLTNQEELKILNFLYSTPLFGTNGLKRRIKLLEFRYD